MPATASTLLLSEPKPLAPTSARITRNRYSLSTKWLSTSVVRITVTGEIDAANATELAGYVFRRSANCRRLILDLTDVGFFGAAGFSTLVDIRQRCHHASVALMVVSGRAVSRVLEICDPRGSLPVGKS
jgi:anti-anti-sigma factor